MKHWCQHFGSCLSFLIAWPVWCWGFITSYQDIHQDIHPFCCSQCKVHPWKHTGSYAYSLYRPLPLPTHAVCSQSGTAERWNTLTKRKYCCHCGSTFMTNRISLMTKGTILLHILVFQVCIQYSSLSREVGGERGFICIPRTKFSMQCGTGLMTVMLMMLTLPPAPASVQ